MNKLGLSIILLLPLALFAQEAEEENKSTVSVRFDVYFWGEQQVASLSEKEFAEGKEMEFKKTELKYRNGDELKTIEVSPGQKVTGFEYRGPATFAFVEPMANEEGEIVETPIARANLLPGMKRVTMMVFEGGSNGMRYSVFPIETSADSVPAGKALVYNLTSIPVAVKAGEQRGIVQPGKALGANLSDAQRFRLPVQMAQPKQGGGWDEVYTRQLVVRPNESLLMLIFQRPNSGALDLKVLKVAES